MWKYAFLILASGSWIPYAQGAAQNFDDNQCVEIAVTSFLNLPSESFAKGTLLKNSLIAVGSLEGTLYLIDSIGNIKTKTQLNSPIFAAPFEMQDGSLALGTEDGNFRVFDAGTLQPKGSLFSLDGVFNAPVQMKDGTLVYGSYDQNAYFSTANAKGSLSFTTHGPVIASPLVLANGDVAIASTDRSIYFTNANAQKKSSFMTGGRIFGSPVQLRDGTVVVAADDGVIYFLSEAGKLKARFKSGGPIVADLTLLKSGNSEIVVASAEDGKVYFVGADGKKTAEYDTKSNFLSAPIIVSDTMVAVSAADGTLYLVSNQGKIKGSFHLDSSPIGTVQSEATGDFGLGKKSGPAPADEYFGHARMSVFGIHSAFQAYSREIAKDHKNAEKLWNSILLTEDALQAWENAYPEDSWLAREYFNLGRVLEKVLTPEAFVRATHTFSWLEAHYPKSWYAKTANLKLISNRLERGFNSSPTLIGKNLIALAGRDGNIYFLKISGQAGACD